MFITCVAALRYVNKVTFKSAETCEPKLTFTESKPLNQLQGENGAFDFVCDGSLDLIIIVKISVQVFLANLRNMSVNLRLFFSIFFNFKTNISVVV